MYILNQKLCKAFYQRTTYKFLMLCEVRKFEFHVVYHVYGDSVLMILGSVLVSVDSKFRKIIRGLYEGADYTTGIQSLNTRFISTLIWIMRSLVIR